MLDISNVLNVKHVKAAIRNHFDKMLAFLYYVHVSLKSYYDSPGVCVCVCVGGWVGCVFGCLFVVTLLLHLSTDLRAKASLTVPGGHSTFLIFSSNFDNFFFKLYLFSSSFGPSGKALGTPLTDLHQICTCTWHAFEGEIQWMVSWGLGYILRLGQGHLKGTSEIVLKGRSRSLQGHVQKLVGRSGNFISRSYRKTVTQCDCKVFVKIQGHTCNLQIWWMVRFHI